MQFKAVAPNVFVWLDTCNVYVIKDGASAILIDIGDGLVLDALSQIGVTTVEWVLYTHHHREQCQGHPKLAGHAVASRGVKIAVPANERAFFENPLSFRALVPKLSDAFTVHGASYVRPPIQPIKVDLAFEKMDSFQWHGRETWCTVTAGNSPGHRSWLSRGLLAAHDVAFPRPANP